MIPQPDQHVKCIFQNSTIIEGIVQSWDKDRAVLLSLSDDSLMVIWHPEEDLMLVKIMPPKNEKETAPVAPSREAIMTKLEEVRKTDDPQLQHKSLQDLRGMVVDQEKKIIASKIVEHYHSGTAKRTKYGYPGFLSIKSTK
jgi:hypothetical protein